MTFKEKHLLPLMIAATLTASCSEDKKFFKKKDPEVQGLLDNRPLKENDKYNTSVTLYQVDVPIYSRNGERIKGQYMLTRGLKSSTYESSQSLEQMSVKRVYINDSKDACYVKVDDNNAIYTERGFCGLFIDYNKKAVIVADANVSQFISELNVKNMNSSSRGETRRTDNSINTSIPDIEMPSAADSLEVKQETSDSLAVDTINTDTVTNERTYNDRQFLDTLNNIRQKEIR
ncbi:MAG: hypothetical protein IJ532_06155 [Alphaproteobacteria bacterium]|nr:hypothetical protein [Alphaproteobacteria bacterium]